MRLSFLSLAAVLLVAGTVTVVTAEAPISGCSTRMPSAERAVCLVKWHQQLMQSMGRGSVSSYKWNSSSSSSSSSSAAHSSSAAGVTHSSSSASSFSMQSCSRAYGVQRALCLVEQRKAVLKLLSTRPVVKPMPQPAVPARKNCSRYSDRFIRAKCLNGEKFSLSSSSSSVSSTAPSVSSSSMSSSAGSVSSSAASVSSGSSSSAGSSSGN